MRTQVGFFSFFLAIMLAVGLSTAQATTLQTTTHAYNDGTGPSAGVWQGIQSYSNFFIFDTLDADVEFAVFAPGNFQNFLNENGIVFADPVPSEYIYAYQVTRIGAGSSGVSNFTVGLNSDEQLGSSGVTFVPAATSHGTYPLVPVQDPSPGGTGGGPGVDSSSVWATIPSFPAGTVTGILFYSSPQVPELGFSTVAAGIAAQSIPNSLPNPVPEPATLGLLILAGGLGLISRRRR